MRKPGEVCCRRSQTRKAMSVNWKMMRKTTSTMSTVSRMMALRMSETLLPWFGVMRFLRAGG